MKKAPLAPIQKPEFLDVTKLALDIRKAINIIFGINDSENEDEIDSKYLDWD